MPLMNQLICLKQMHLEIIGKDSELRLSPSRSPKISTDDILSAFGEQVVSISFDLYWSKI